jgi:hypothetical protein
MAGSPTEIVAMPPRLSRTGTKALVTHAPCPSSPEPLGRARRALPALLTNSRIATPVLGVCPSIEGILLAKDERVGFHLAA